MTTAPRYYLDTEFYDNGKNDLRLISLALVCDDGRELYLCDASWLGDDGRPDTGPADDWLRANVFPQLPPCTCPENPTWRRGALDFVHKAECCWRRDPEMRQLITEFVKDPGNGGRVEFWAYFASYDWILLCWLFGKMIDLPKHFQWLVHDLRTWATNMGYTGKFRELLPDSGHHDALHDARWNRDVHKILQERFMAEAASAKAQLQDMQPPSPYSPLNAFTVGGLLRYAQHKYDCDWLQPMWHKGPCDCGFQALIEQLPEDLRALLVDVNEHVRATVEYIDAETVRNAQEKSS